MQRSRSHLNIILYLNKSIWLILMKQAILCVSDWLITCHQIRHNHFNPCYAFLKTNINLRQYFPELFPKCKNPYECGNNGSISLISPILADHLIGCESWKLRFNKSIENYIMERCPKLVILSQAFKTSKMPQRSPRSITMLNLLQTGFSLGLSFFLPHHYSKNVIVNNDAFL